MKNGSCLILGHHRKNQLQAPSQSCKRSASGRRWSTPPCTCILQVCLPHRSHRKSSLFTVFSIIFILVDVPQLGFKALETIALTYYEAQLSKSDTNVLDELFGPMAAQYVQLSSLLPAHDGVLTWLYPDRYVDLKNLALLAVVKRWDQLKNSPALAQKMTEITSGRFPSAGQIMAELWAKVSAVAEKVPTVRELEPEEISPARMRAMRRRRLVEDSP